MLYYRDFRKAVLHRKIKSVPIEFYFLLNCFIKEEKKSIGTNLMCLKKVYLIEIEGGIENEYWLHQSEYRRTKHH